MTRDDAEHDRRTIAGLKHACCGNYNRGDLDALVELFTEGHGVFPEIGTWRGTKLTDWPTTTSSASPPVSPPLTPRGRSA